MIFISVFIQHIIGKYEHKSVIEVTIITRWPKKYDLSVGGSIVKLFIFFSWKATSPERCVFTIHKLLHWYLERMFVLVYLLTIIYSLNCYWYI